MERKSITPNYDARLLAEVNNFCPLCGKRLLEEKNGRSLKSYQIAHIYPHSPTGEQIAALTSAPKPNDSEAFENMIALCKDCHAKQDFHTTIEDYMRLFNLKMKLMSESKAMDGASRIPIETQIEEVMQKLIAVDAKSIQPLSYAPVAVERKIEQKNSLLRVKITNYVVQFFPFVQAMFGQMDGAGKLKFEKLAAEVKLCFLNMEEQRLPQDAVFDGIVRWIHSKTQSKSVVACEIIVAFYVQNCEVFNEITK